MNDSITINLDIIAGEIILLVVGFFINNWRLTLGQAGNKGKKYGSIVGYMLMSILIILGSIYIVVIQDNILWLEFITFIIVLIFLVTGIFMFFKTK
jgi:hypothetical protein